MSIRSAAVKLVVFAVVAALFGAALASTLTRGRPGADTSRYRAEFSNASGLEAGDLVRVAGVVVGQVEEVALGAGNAVTVTFDADRDQHLTEATEAFVRYENLLGDRYLELAQDPGAKSPHLRSGATIPATRTAPALDLNVLLNGFKPLFAGLDPAQVNELATKIIHTLQGRAGTVEELLARTGSLTTTIADQDLVIGDLIDSLNVVLARLNSNDDQFRDTITHLQNLVSGLAKDRDPIGRAVASVNRLTRSATRLLVAVRPALRTNIQRAQVTAAILNRDEKGLERLLNDIPDALEVLSRVGSHGAFFNFYLCGVKVRVTGPQGRLDLPGLTSNSETDRCKPLGDN